MAIRRKIKCDICAVEVDEPAHEAGWVGWGALQGVVLNGAPSPNFCPACLTEVAEFVDSKVVHHGVD